MLVYQLALEIHVRSARQESAEQASEECAGNLHDQQNDPGAGVRKSFAAVRSQGNLRPGKCYGDETAPKCIAGVVKSACWSWLREKDDRLNGEKDLDLDQTYVHRGNFIGLKTYPDTELQPCERRIVGAVIQRCQNGQSQRD